MSINLRPLNKNDDNYSKVISLYKKAFTTVRHIPSWILRLKLRHGKAGFNVLYSADTWIGLLDITEYQDTVLVNFFAIEDAYRSGGYGSKVIDFMKTTYRAKRIILNIEMLDPRANNSAQRVRRRAFYQKNGFKPSGYLVEDKNEQLETLIFGGSIDKCEIEAIYHSRSVGLFSRLFGRPKVLTI